MADIKTKTGIRQLTEYRAQLRLGATNGFSLVHVLDTDKSTEVPPPTKIDNCIGMNNQRKIAISY